MGLKNYIHQLILSSKKNKLYQTQFQNLPFQYAVIPFQKIYFSFPERLVKDKYDIPFLLIWENADKEGIYFYSFADLLIGEVAGRQREPKEFILDENVYYINQYFPKPIEKFDERQMFALLDGSYWGMHNKYSDVYAEMNYLFKTYRDKFDDKRYKQIIKNFDWYFYIEKKDYDKMMRTLQEHAGMIKKCEEDGKWMRVYAKYMAGWEWFKRKDAARTLIEKLDGKIQTYEGDIDPAMRYTIDTNLSIETNLKILYYDIETDDTTNEIVIGKDRILSIAGVDRDGLEYFKCTNNEKTLLNDFTTYIKNYDLIVGYNNYNFDDAYIMDRCRLYKSYYKPHHRDWRIGRIDMMRRIIGTFGRLSGLSRFSLEHVSQHYLGKGKVEKNKKIIDLYKNDRGLLREYNLTDCYLVKELDEKLGVVDLMVAMCEWTGSFVTLFKPTYNVSGVSVSQPLDMFILRKAKKEEIHYKTATWKKNEEDRYEGAHIFEPNPGIYKDVHIFDFKSLYPTIIWSWRISPENLKRRVGGFQIKEDIIRAANDIKFYKYRKAIFPLLVQELMTARKEYKALMTKCNADSTEYKKYNMMQLVTKEITNALYGQIGQRGNRYFDTSVAEAVTSAGRFLLKKTKTLCEEMGLSVIYGDTDSTFVTGLKFKPEYYINEINRKLKGILKEEFNIDESIVEMEYEKKLSKFILIMKKNYTGLMSELDGEPVDRVLIKGLECIRKSTINIAKKAQRHLIETILRNDYSINYYINMINKMKEDFYKNDPPMDELVLKTSISKYPHEFKVTKQPHVRVAEWLISNNLEFYVGMQIPYIIVDKKNRVEVHPSKYEGVFDKDYYWQRIYSPLMRILSVCFKDHDWAQYDTIEADKRERRKKRVKNKTRQKKMFKGKFVIKEGNYNKLFKGDENAI